MSTPFSMEWKLVTNGKEKRVGETDNIFEVVFDGYKLFPIQEPIDLMRLENKDQIGTAKVVKLIFEESQTICRYQLISLYSVN